MNSKEPSVVDTIAGIGAALLAAAMMLAAVLVPLVLLMAIVDQGAGAIFAGVLVLAGAIALAFYWVRRREHHSAARHSTK